MSKKAESPTKTEGVTVTRPESVTFEFTIPKGMKANVVAQTFAACLAHPTALFRIVKSWEDARMIGHVPPHKHVGFPPYWQLDERHDFWLVEIPDENRAQLFCRRGEDADIGEALVRLLIRHSM